MDAQIEDIYSEKIRERETDPRYKKVLEIITRASQGVPLRPDAVYFLANNITDMVVKPIDVARERNLTPKTRLSYPRKTCLTTLRMI